MENAISEIKCEIEKMRDEAYDAMHKSTQTNEMIYHRAEKETLDKVLGIIKKENCF